LQSFVNLKKHLSYLRVIALFKEYTNAIVENDLESLKDICEPKYF